MSLRNQLGWSLSLGLILNSYAFTLAPWAVAASAIQPSADETALRELGESFYRVWASKDRDGYWRLWSANAPELETIRRVKQGFFANNDGVELRGLTLRAVKLDGDKGRVSLEVDARWVEAQSGEPKGRYVKMRQTLECVKEAGRWKIWRETSAFDELAAALVAAKSEAERAALLTGEKELVTAGLVHALNVHSNRLPYPQSLVINQLAQGIGEQVGDQLGTSRSLSNIGHLHQSQGNYAQAAEYFQMSLALNQQLGNKELIAAALSNLGSLQQIQGNNAPALEYYRQSLAMSEAAGYKAGIAVALNNIGSVHLYQGDYAQALAYGQQSLALRESLGIKTGIAGSLYLIGRAHHLQGDYAEALDYLQHSLAIREAMGAKAAIADTLLHLGFVYQAQGGYALALEQIRKGLVISEALGDKALIARTLYGLGNAYLSQNNYAQALEYFRKSLALSEALGIKVTMANTLNSIGILHRLQGNYAQALAHHQQSLVLNEALGDKGGIANQVNNIGIIYHEQGNYAPALAHFRKTLQTWEGLGAKSGIAAALNNIGRVYYSQGNYAQALEYLQRGLALNETLGAQAGTARLLSNLSEVYEKQGDYVKALDITARAAVLARATGDSDTLQKTRFTAGRAYRALKEPAQARQAFEEAIAITETLRVQVAGGEEEQQRFFASRVAPYHAMIDLLTREGRAAEAFTFAERAKARVLLDVLQTGRVNITKSLAKEEPQQEHKLRAALISLNTQVTRASQQNKTDQARLGELKALREKARLNYEALQTSLYAAHPELRVRRGEAPVIKAEELATLLPDADSVLLEYVVADEATYLFVITKGAGKSAAEVLVYILPIKRDELSKQTESLRQQLASRDLGFRTAARELYQLLLKPAQAQLAGKTKLVIVPDDKLWELPFQALLADGNRYLIERSAVAYAPSLTVLREMMKPRHSKAPAATLLALGNPALGKETMARAALVLRDEKLAPLPEAEAEVKALGKLYGAMRSKIYVGAEAREDRAKREAGSFKVLHFATHGILNDHAPMYSHLVLTPGDAPNGATDDGLLEAWELMELDLQADLAVLSACETARGRASAGEGVIGLTWALFVAGVPATVVSQWKVEAASTRDLMMDFHRALNVGAGKTPMTKAAALRQAALRLMKNPGTNHPFYWAGFVLIGDGR